MCACVRRGGHERQKCVEFVLISLRNDLKIHPQELA